MCWLVLFIHKNKEKQKEENTQKKHKKRQKDKQTNKQKQKHVNTTLESKGRACFEVSFQTAIHELWWQVLRENNPCQRTKRQYFGIWIDLKVYSNISWKEFFVICLYAPNDEKATCYWLWVIQQKKPNWGWWWWRYAKHQWSYISKKERPNMQKEHIFIFAISDIPELGRLR